jgi:putative membrane fusion protein
MRRLKTGNILMVIAIVLIFSYILYEAYSVTHIRVQTETAVLSTIYDKVDAKALVIRDEHTLANASSGVTVPALDDGDKINVGGRVAMVFSSPEAAESYSEYTKINRELEHYENLERQTLSQTASVDSINSEIDRKVDSYIRAVALHKSEAMQSAGNGINDAIVRRQMLIGEDVDLVSIIQDLRQKKDALSQNAKPSQYIDTDTSGVFSGYTDGYENLIDYTKAEELTADEVEKAIETVSKPKKNENGYMGKLITTYAWYMACVVDASSVRDLSDGYKVKVALKDNDDTVLTAQIVSGADVEPNQKKTLLIMRCSNMDKKLASLRVADIELRIKKYTGIKVPAGALHVNGDKKGVYALVSSQVNFRETEVIYSGDDFVLLKYDPENPKGIRLYDKVILQGKELEDGKVYT